MTHRLLATIPVLLLFPAAPCAQEPAKPTAASFMPDEPQGEFLIDFRTMRERGIWEEVEATLLAPVFRQMEKELGFPLAGLDRLHMWLRMPADAEPQSQSRIVVMEGKVALPPSVGNGMWTDERIGDYDAKVFPHGPAGRASMIVRVGEDLLVTCPRELAEPVLLGKAKGGRPGADQMSLLSGRTTELLHVYVDLVAARRGKGEFGFLGEIEYPEDDPATHLLLRIRTHGDDDDPHLMLEGVVRHRKGEQGLELTETAARKWLEEMQQHPRLAALKKIWSAVGFARKGTDLTAQLDLGRPRAGVGVLAQLMAPIFAPRAVAQEAAAAAEAAARAAQEEAKRKAEEERRKKEGGGK
jgi:hypothetical protein